MKALTLWQPWASLVALGVKTIETRSWSTKYRGPLAIHAGAKKPARIWTQYERPDLYDDIRIEPYLDIQEDGNNPGQFAYDWVGPLGAVVATSILLDVVPILAGDLAERADMDDLPYPRVESHVGLGPDFLDGWLDLYHPTMGSAVDPEDDGRSIPDQAPYGDFMPGRFAWLLDNIIRLPEPPAARGGQRIWNWRE